MHVRLRDHRMDERHLVDATGQVRNQIADPFAALAALPPLPGALHARAGVALKQFDLLARIKRLAVAANQLRLVIERVALARRARHKQLHDATWPWPDDAGPHAGRGVAPARARPYDSAANSPSLCSMLASATPPSPPPNRQRNSRREACTRSAGIGARLSSGRCWVAQLVVGWLCMKANRARRAGVNRQTQIRCSSKSIGTRSPGHDGRRIRPAICASSSPGERDPAPSGAPAVICPARSAAAPCARAARCSACRTNKRIIPERERLQRRQCRVSFGRQQRRIRTIQALHQRVGHAPDDKPVDAAAIRLRRSRRRSERNRRSANDRP